MQKDNTYENQKWAPLILGFLPYNFAQKEICVYYCYFIKWIEAIMNLILLENNIIIRFAIKKKKKDTFYKFLALIFVFFFNFYFLGVKMKKILKVSL